MAGRVTRKGKPGGYVRKKKHRKKRAQVSELRKKGKIVAI